MHVLTPSDEMSYNMTESRCGIKHIAISRYKYCFKNDVFLQKTQEKDQFVMLNRNNTGQTQPSDG